jgi:hypothetical protein
MTVNQANGRVIRDNNDYGAIMLIDEKYKTDWNKNERSKAISAWMINRPKPKAMPSFVSAKKQLSLNTCRPEEPTNIENLCIALKNFYKENKFRDPPRDAQNPFINFDDFVLEDNF